MHPLPTKPRSKDSKRSKNRDKERGARSRGASPRAQAQVQARAAAELPTADLEAAPVLAPAPGLEDGEEPRAEIGDEYVPLPESEKEDTPEPVREGWFPKNRRGKDKGKERDRDREGDRDRDGDRGEGGSTLPDKGKDRERDRDGDKGKGKRPQYDPADGYPGKRERVNAASRRAPWVRDVDWEGCRNVTQMLHREVVAFIDYMSPTPQEDEARGLIIALVSRAVSQAFPDATVLAFGSYETKLYLPLGDIDLVIQSASMAYSHKHTVLKAVADTVRRAGITDKVSIIAGAKVPIVKFVTTHGRFSVDISINQTNGVAAGQMVKRFLDALPALRALVVVVKAFLGQRSMNEVYTGGLGSYSIVCLAISFLQMHPKVRRAEIDPAQNLGVLVVEFFEFYGLYFNYQDVGISLRDGGTYYNKAQRGWNDFRQAYLLSIEDPADTNNDISRGTYGIARVRQTFAGAFSILTAAAYQRENNMSARRSGHYISFRDNRTDPEEWSILSSVMGVTQEMINHRRVVREVYDNGVLHRMLGVEPNSGPDAGGRRSRTPPPLLDRASGKRSLESTWVAADDDADSDIVEVAPDQKRNKGQKRRKKDQTPPKSKEDEEEESRYGIVKDAGPPKKRKRLGNKADLHTVFTTDDEDGEVRESEGEDGEYDLEEVEEKGKRKGGSRGSTSRDERRSFWLSKGVGLQDEPDSS